MMSYNIPKTSGCRKPVWMDMAGLYPDDRDCLAAFIAFRAAEVLAGIKPSSLINLVNRPIRCGKNLYALWKEHGEEILLDSALEAKVMTDRTDSMLLLIYDRAALKLILSRRSVQVLLRKSGYRDGLHVDALLTEFASRFDQGWVPHEIGIVLGYPLKDVAGFLGLGRLRFSCQGPWRIYGNPRESLLLAERHFHCRCRMAGLLLSGCAPCDCLAGNGGSEALPKDGIFCCGNENENHFK